MLLFEKSIVINEWKLSDMAGKEWMKQVIEKVVMSTVHPICNQQRRLQRPSTVDYFYWQ